MNRRPNQSRNDYDAYYARQAARLNPLRNQADFFAERKKPSFMRNLLLGLAAAAALFFVVNFACSRFVFVRRETVPIRGLSEAFEGYTILHITDLKGERFGKKQALFDFALSGKEFDLVLITGDMISPMGNAQPYYELLECLKALNSDAPVYYISGDSDPVPLSMEYADSGSPFASWVLGADARGAQLLGSPVSIEREGQRIWLTTRSQMSLDLDAMQQQYERQYLSAISSGDENHIEMTTYQLASLEGMRQARKEMTQDDVYIALAHTLPEAGDAGAFKPAAIPRAVDLMLGGHYLGGLVRLPGVGPLFVPSVSARNYGILPGKEGYGGLSRAGSTWLYAGTGLGSKDDLYPAVFFRLLNPPSVTLISLTPSSL